MTEIPHLATFMLTSTAPDVNALSAPSVANMQCVSYSENTELRLQKNMNKKGIVFVCMTKSNYGFTDITGRLTAAC